jgi:hypothetical protein
MYLIDLVPRPTAARVVDFVSPPTGLPFFWNDTQGVPSPACAKGASWGPGYAPGLGCFALRAGAVVRANGTEEFCLYIADAWTRASGRIYIASAKARQSLAQVRKPWVGVFVTGAP